MMTRELILVVDDDEDLAPIICEAIAEGGHRPRHARNGREGLIPGSSEDGSGDLDVVTFRARFGGSPAAPRLRPLQTCRVFKELMKPTSGFEPLTYGLRNRCSTD
jgi:hypothetical protein